MSRRMVEPLTELGRVIRGRRLALGHKQISLAEELGVSRSYVSLLETGKLAGAPSPSFIKKLGERLKIDRLELAGLLREPSRPAG